MRLLHREPDTARDAAAPPEAEGRTAGRDRRAPMFGTRTRDREVTAAGTALDTDRTDRTDRTRRTGRVDRTDRVAEAEPTRRRDRLGRHRPRPERIHKPFHLGNVLALIGGGVLAVIGIVALVRGDLNDTWARPVTTVLEIDHTPLTAVIEIAAGALLVLLAATGLRLLALAGAAALAVGATAVAIEPGRLATTYALEQWWAGAVAGVSAFVALVLLLPSGRRRTVVEVTPDPGPA
ncbi:MAG TPA: hypothetical protein VFI47_26570 [Acidimicrobiales bacterium]|nr:hypothetical protein [Acidimicrobiales bacterium]